MLAYVITRTVRWGSGLLLVLVTTYAMMFYGAGDPVKRMFDELSQGGAVFDKSVQDAMRKELGLDKPFHEQFINYLVKLSQGNLGISIRERRPVINMVRVRLPISVQIGLMATGLAALIGIPLGVLAALKHNRWTDTTIVGSAVFINAVPVFVTGPLLLVFFVLVLDIMDVPFGWKGPFDKQIILPLILMTMAPLPALVRQTRAGLLEVMGEDYIRTARAKGLTERMVVMRHMLRPVLIPVITVLGFIMIGLVNGALFVETIFNIPGFGQLTYQGLTQVDYPVIMAVVLIGTVIVMVGNLLVDLAYPLLDPRITAGK
jgi:ABC-type dipeptide/oligopeptide/nickel transport system permease component